MASQKNSIFCIALLLLSASVCMGGHIQLGILSLKAIKINDQPVTPSNQITANPGDIIECNIFLSDWSPGDLEFGVRGYEFILIGDSFFSGDRGTVLPLGWDAPFGGRTCITDDECNGTFCDRRSFCDGRLFCSPIFCFEDSECGDPYPVCWTVEKSDIGIHCTTKNHNPELGAFVDKDRPDFIFHEFLNHFSGPNVSSLKYRFGGALFFDEAEDQGVPVYMGTLILEVSDGSGNKEAACGTFEIIFDTRNCIDRSYIVNFDGTKSFLAPQESLFIDIVCNPPDDTRGACCNTRFGSCTNTIIAQCSGTHLNWTKGENCSTQNCPDPFIPTVSQWGLVIMTLVLLIGGKLYFGVKHNEYAT